MTALLERGEAVKIGGTVRDEGRSGRGATSLGITVVTRGAKGRDRFWIATGREEGFRPGVGGRAIPLLHLVVTGTGGGQPEQRQQAERRQHARPSPRPGKLTHPLRQGAPAISVASLPDLWA